MIRPTLPGGWTGNGKCLKCGRMRPGVGGGCNQQTLPAAELTRLRRSANGSTLPNACTRTEDAMDGVLPDSNHHVAPGDILLLSSRGARGRGSLLAQAIERRGSSR